MVCTRCVTCRYIIIIMVVVVDCGYRWKNGSFMISSLTIVMMYDVWCWSLRVFKFNWSLKLKDVWWKVLLASPSPAKSKYLKQCTKWFDWLFKICMWHFLADFLLIWLLLKKNYSNKQSNQCDTEMILYCWPLPTQKINHLLGKRKIICFKNLKIPLHSSTPATTDIIKYISIRTTSSNSASWEGGNQLQSNASELAAAKKNKIFRIFHTHMSLRGS